VSRWSPTCRCGTRPLDRANGTKVLAIEPTLHDATVMGPNIMDKRRRAAVTRHTVFAMTHRLTRGDLAVHRDLFAEL
jgi:hypothetical protein